MSKKFIQNVSVSSKGKNTDPLSSDGSTIHLIVSEELNIKFGLALDYYQHLLQRWYTVFKYTLILLLLTINILKKRTRFQVNDYCLQTLHPFSFLTRTQSGYRLIKITCIVLKNK